MGKTDTRRRAKRRIDNLSEDRLQVADDFLAYLEERDSNEATEELIRIPGFAEEFEEARKDVEAGRLTPVKDLKRKY